MAGRVQIERHSGGINNPSGSAEFEERAYSAFRAASAAQPGPAGQGPSFGRYREVNGHASGVEDSASRAAGSAGKNKTGAPLKPAIPENHTADDDAASRTRPVDRRS